MTVGGWSEFHTLTKDEDILFKEVMGNIYGVSYKPIVVSTQVVSGMNYCFICRATSMTNPPAECRSLHLQTCRKRSKTLLHSYSPDDHVKR